MFWGYTERLAVPVIAVFTKCEALHAIAFRKLRNEGKRIAEAAASAPERADAMFIDYDYYGMLERQPLPPQGFVCLKGKWLMEGYDCIWLN